MQDISLKLAKFAVETRTEDIPEDVMAVQKKSIMDAIAVTLGASGIGEGCREFVDYAVEAAAGGRGEAAVIGCGVKLPVVLAAFANGSMAHSLDFSDTQARHTFHSNESTFAAAVSVADYLGGVNGRDFIAAMVIGSEVACRVASAILDKRKLPGQGWFMPSILVVYGATAAAGRLLGLNAKQMVDAFSFTLCQAMCSSELMNSGDSVMRSVREAFMARSAVVSALIAKKNMKGFDAPFEGKMGFYHAFIRDEVDLDRVTEGLGSVWQAKDLCFKLWPSCLGTHSSIDAMLQLVKEHGIKPQEIDEVHVIVSSVNQMLLEPDQSRKAPESVINAKFSIPYTAAVAAVRQRVTLEDFDDASLHDPLVRQVASKFTYDLNEDWAPAGRQLTTQMTAKTPRGSFYREVVWPYGHVNNPCTDEELGAKIYACAKHSRVPLSEDRVEKLVETVGRLEELDDIRELTALL